MLRTALYRLTHNLRSLRLTETLKSIGLEVICRFGRLTRVGNKAVLLVVLAVVLTPVSSAIYSYTRVGTPVYAAAPSTLNFQARIMGQNGAIVADGNYSVQFKLYDAVTGGSNVWTETQTVTIKGGYLSVSLGAITPFGSVDFANQHWLTMNVAGDGEMNPRIRLTAVPYAFAATKAGGLTSGSSVITADGFAQVAPAGLQSLNSTNSALRLNQTGAGGLLQFQGNGSDVLTISKTGALTTSGLITGNGGLTVTGGASISGGLSLNSSAISGVTTLGLSGSITGATTNTINGLNINAGALSGVTGITFTSGNLDLGGGNITNAGTISGASGAFNVDANGNITSAFTALNGSSTANGGSGLGSSTSLTLTSAANFEVGNYVRVANANCGGTGINVCYAKITAKATNTLTISPALTWANGAAVTEYRVPEVGGTNGSQPLENRFGRGYFISGVATGNGTTFYTEDGISTTLTSFSIANENVTTLNIGGAASSITLGTIGTTVSVSGSLQTAASQTITAGGGLVVNSGGLNLNTTNITNAGAISGITGLTFTSGSLNLTGGGITNTGALAGVTTISATGSITAATTNTINGLSVNAGTLTGVTGITFTSGGLNINNGGITNSGSITGVGANITGAGALTLASGGTSDLTLDSASGIIALAANDTTLRRTAAGTYSIELNDASATTLSLNNTGAGSATLNLVDGGLQIGGTTVLSSTRVLSNITGLTTTGGASISGGLNNNTGGITNTGALAGVTTISATGGITAATTGTINGLSINSGALSDITGLTFTSGNLNLANGGAVNVGSLAGVTTLSLSGAITGATATNTINGLIINAGSLSGITGYGQTSGNFAMSGTGTFSTGTGAVALNGAVTAASTLAVTGQATFNGNVSLQTGDTITVNGDAIRDFTGSGLINASGVLNIDTTTAGTVAGTGSNSGLIVAADGISLLRGCANNQILKWSTTGPQWNCAADNTGVSDSRLKTNVVAVDQSVLSRLRDVKLYSFDYDCSHDAFKVMHCDTDRQQAGVMAQELMQLFPELVTEVNGYYQVRYDALGLYSLKALGELATEVDSIRSLATTNGLATGGVLRLNNAGSLTNITGLQMSSGGASVVGGLNNNMGGMTNVGALSGVSSLTLSASGSGNVLQVIKDNQGVFTIANSGALEMRLSNQRAFGVQDAEGRNIFGIDSLSGNIRIGSGNEGKLVLFTLDNKVTAGDPSNATNGAQYYNSATNKFRCYQNNAWRDCLPNTHSEYALVMQPQQWQQSGVLSEMPGSQRSWVDLSEANQFRVIANINATGAAQAACKVQSSTDNGQNWQDLGQNNEGVISLAQGGTIKSDWVSLSNGAKAESLLRVACEGGNDTTTPAIGSVKLQAR